MSKVIHWNIPFQSVKGVDYSLYIIDENGPSVVGTPDVIQAGDTPFTTEEDTNTDFFSPVRGSTGTISLVDTDGTIMSSMIPDNNTARSVQLVKTVNNVQSIAWQGFLTCNTYSQGYTYRPQICELQVASLLEAADSISAKQTDFVGLMTVRQIITKCIAAIQSEYGYGTIFNTIYFPKADWRILYFYINTSIFFEEKEVSNENAITYITVGKSIKEILTTICTYMGWCVRECPNKILSFQRLNDQNATDYYYIAYSDFSDDNKALGTYLHGGTKVNVNIQNLTYRGTGHEIETAAGAKEVAVIANTKGENWEIKLPEVPAGALKKAKYSLNYIKDTSRNPRRFTYYVNTDKMAHSNINYAVQKGKYDPYSRGSASYLGEETANPDLLFTEALGMLKYNSNGTQASYPVPYNDVTIYSGAFLLKYYYEDIEADGDNYYPVNQSDFKDGLYACFLPNLIDSVSTVHPIFKIQTTKALSLGDGYLQLTCDIGAFIWRCGEMTAAAGEYALLDSLNTPICSSMPRIKFALRYGDYCMSYGVGGITSMVNYGTTFIPYFDGSKFASNYSLLSSPTIEHEEGILVPITSSMSGQITLEFYAEAGMITSNLASFYAIIFNSLGVKFIPANGAIPTRSGGSNSYREILGVNFNDEETINTDLASDMNNNESPHILRYTLSSVMQYMTYSYPDGDTTNRPERDLLARLAKYYKKKRRTIQVEVEQINEHLPITRVTDGSIQLQPLAESMDWALDKATVTLMEESADSET